MEAVAETVKQDFQVIDDEEKGYEVTEDVLDETHERIVHRKMIERMEKTYTDSTYVRQEIVDALFGVKA